MQINNHHLTYCSNIHPGESWKETFENLEKYIPEIKKNLNIKAPFAIGLRLSNEASLVIQDKEKLVAFKKWLDDQNCYIFTFNGFPYGSFHREVVKDDVHSPDWTTEDRKAYTLRLFDILAFLLREGMDGGISTSPLSYRHWHSQPKDWEYAMTKSTEQMVEVAIRLYEIKLSQGKTLHLDIEPEPDGMLENCQETLDFYRNWLLPIGIPAFMERFDLTEKDAALALKDHIRICYDVCHFAVVYENHGQVFKAFENEGIKIGKIQISAALKIPIPKTPKARKEVEKTLFPFVESTYLHQVVGRNSANELFSYRDLPDALVSLANTDQVEWRIHFHVPIFLDTYGQLSSTQDDILNVLGLIKKKSVTPHLEIETYTWEVLPEDIHLTLGESISREIQWTIENM
ncbi:metabolite traffic protein EboE [Lunatibacter salilacus]|uniref:metabolite traffic protein EboE n=1 Tax=Lunatibacter salilacus TaxID=2483804 RepID=UPI00131C50DE|nr:metabolite traffic protein EboE [Lunatibacter salilacus]